MTGLAVGERGDLILIPPCNRDPQPGAGEVGLGNDRGDSKAGRIQAGADQMRQPQGQDRPSDFSRAVEVEQNHVGDTHRAGPCCRRLTGSAQVLGGGWSLTAAWPVGCCCHGRRASPGPQPAPAAAPANKVPACGPASAGSGMWRSNQLPMLFSLNRCLRSHGSERVRSLWGRPGARHAGSCQLPG